VNPTEPDWKIEDRELGIREGRACVFAAVLPALRAKARELGYALAIHGSMVRDLDLVAAPWVQEAADAQVLARALQDLLGGYYVGDSGSVYAFQTLPAALKPHGRMAFTLRFGGDRLVCVDLSVMPRAAEAGGGA
jgi:hypothetical protein